MHNAALCPAVDTVSLTDADLEATLAVNIRAPHVLTAPGATRTPVNAGADDVIARMTASTPAGAPGTSEDVAAAVAWVVSDQATYVHGAVIPVDGGITATRPV